MNKFQFNKTLPLILGQAGLFIFIQKFLYWHGVDVYGSKILLDAIAHDYYTVLPALLLLTAIIIYYLIHLRGSFTPSKSLLIITSIATFIASGYVLFGLFNIVPDPLNSIALAVFTLIICIGFCIVFFAWLNRIKLEAPNLGIRTILLSTLVAYLIYCLITPVYGNNSFYLQVVELLSLPLSALFYLIPSKEISDQQAPLTQSSKDGVSYIGAVSLLFFIVFLIAYVDYLNMQHPVKYVEHPTFYAILLLSIVGLIAFINKGEQGETIFNWSFSNFIQAIGAFIFIIYIVIVFFSSSSYGFFFEFICAFRRFIFIIFLILFYALAFEFNVKIETAGILFLTPFLLARVIMRTFYLQISIGHLESTVDFRLLFLVALGILLVICSNIPVYLFRRKVRESFNHNEIATSQFLDDSARSSAVGQLSKEFGLSDRESEILFYLSMGYSVSKISELLAIKGNTVGTHTHSIYKKMEIHNKQEAIDAVAKTMNTASI